MSFLSDLGSFLSNAQQFNNELSGVKDDLVNQAMTAASQVSDQMDEVSQELSQTKDTAVDTLQQTKDSFSSSLNN